MTDEEDIDEVVSDVNRLAQKLRTDHPLLERFVVAPVRFVLTLVPMAAFLGAAFHVYSEAVAFPAYGLREAHLSGGLVVLGLLVTWRWYRWLYAEDESYVEGPGADIEV